MELNYREKIFLGSVLFLIPTIFIREFVQTSFLNRTQLFLFLIMVASCLVLAKGVPLYMSLFTLTMGHVLLFIYGMSYGVWLDGITKNLPIVVLLATVPLLTIPLKNGDYLHNVHSFFNRFADRPRHLFAIISILIYCLGSVANLGALRIVHPLIEDLKFSNKYSARLFAAGYISCSVWSPYFISVTLILHYTGLSFTQYLKYGVIYSLCLIIIGNIIFGLLEAKNTQIKIAEVQASAATNTKPLLIALGGLFISIILVEKFVKFSSAFLLVSFVSAIYAILWSVAIGKLKQFFSLLRTYSNVVIQIKNESVFFISVGFLGIILVNTPVRGIIERTFSVFFGLPPFLLIISIIGLVVTLSSLGLHQVITITTLALSLDPGTIGLSNIAFTLTLVGSYAMSITISPFVPYNIVLAGLLKENVFKIGLKWNLALGITWILFSGAFISVINIFTK